MTDTQTIDEILRAKGRNKLNEELVSLFRPLHERIRLLPIYAGLFGPKGEEESESTDRGCHGELEGDKVLDMLQKTIFETLKTKYEQTEVAAFLTKLDGISKEVENLRNEVLG